MKAPDYIIISTYPQYGSRNVGDKLIEDSVRRALLDTKGSQTAIQTFFRQENLADHLDMVNSSKGLILACLAIRQDIFPHVYAIGEVINSIKVPIYPISSGTHFVPAQLNLSPYAYSIDLGKRTEKAIHRINSVSPLFSCRDVLTYNYLHSIGIK